MLDQLSDSTVSVYIVPDFFVFELLHSRWTSMGGLPAVSVFENPLFGVDGVVKRVADLMIATLALLDCGHSDDLDCASRSSCHHQDPVFFRQRRYGLDGREILVWKFRSMNTCDNGPVVKQATKDDPRITRVGAILRRTSLDELPQLFNVIDGSMSLVGPRPHANAHNEQYRSLIRGYMLRHKVKPGITGLAQVNGCRGETETIDKMQRRVDMGPPLHSQLVSVAGHQDPAEDRWRLFGSKKKRIDATSKAYAIRLCNPPIQSVRSVTSSK